MMNYIYSELCKAVEKVTYEGLDSKTAAVVVDNEKNTIQVNIIDVPAELLNPNVDVLGPSGRYLLLATLDLNAVTYKWVTIEDFMKELESEKEAIYTRIENEATRTDNMIKQVNDNVSLVVNQLNKNMADGFNTINGGIATEIQERKDADSALDTKIESEIERATQAEQENKTALNAKANINHASLGTDYGVGDSTHYGHVKVDAIPTSQSFNAVSSQGVYGQLANKVDKVEGKQLSSEDFTTVEKTKLAGIEENANYYVLPEDVVKSVAGMIGPTVELGTLTFTGAATGSYNGRANVTLNIPTIAGPTGPQGATGPMPELTSERGTSANVAMSQLGIENLFYGTKIQLGNKSNNAYSTDSIVIGNGATASGYGATALGNGATASEYTTIALGGGAKASGRGAIALGYGAKAETAYTIVLGNAEITALECQVQTISALSDKRVKEDVSLANTSQCLVDVNRLPVSRYKYKDFTGTHLDVHRTGFMADDVEKVFPKAVIIADRTFPLLDEDGNKVYEQEVDKEGNPVVDEYGNPVMKEKTFVMEDVKTIAMEMAIPTMWGAIQELTKRVEYLENERK